MKKLLLSFILLIFLAGCGTVVKRVDKEARCPSCGFLNHITIEMGSDFTQKDIKNLNKVHIEYTCDCGKNITFDYITVTNIDKKAEEE